MRTTTTVNKKQNLAECIFEMIREKPGKICAADMHERFNNKEQVYSALSRLRNAGKIKTKRGFGKKGVVWVYIPIE